MSRTSRAEWGTVHAGAPNEYLQMLRLGYRAVKEANPDAIVVSGALTPTGINNPAIAVDDKVYLQRLLAINQGEAARYFDALGVHVTAGPNAPDDSVASPTHSRATCNGGWANHSSFFFTRYQELYEVMRAAGITDKPIWITEVGWPVATNPAPNFRLRQLHQRAGPGQVPGSRVRKGPHRDPVRDAHVRVESELPAGVRPRRRALGVRDRARRSIATPGLSGLAGDAQAPARLIAPALLTRPLRRLFVTPV